LEAKTIARQKLLATDVSERQVADLSEKHAIHITKGGNRQAVAKADVIVLAVKPHLIGEVLSDIRGALRTDQVLISVAAGVPIDFLEQHLAKPKGRSRPKRQPIVRAMPNIAMTVHASATALCANAAASDQHRQIAEQIFRSVGTVTWVTEDKMHAVTALSGSGPAYVYLIVEGLTAGGVNMGLPRDVACALALQTLLGAAKLAQNSGEHPAALRDRVTTPGGTTIAGLAELEHYGVRSALMEAVEAATERSEELSRKL